MTAKFLQRQAGLALVMAMALAGFGSSAAAQLNGSKTRVLTVRQPSRPDRDAAFWNRVRSIETQRKLWDETLWQRERLAEKHEAPFLRLWDDLRIAQDPFRVLEAFRFEQLLMPTFEAEPTLFEQGWKLYEPASKSPSLTHSEWREKLATWKSQGYLLDQSEWRLSDFEFRTNAASRAALDVKFHVRNTTRAERWIVRGTIEIEFAFPNRATEAPMPRIIDARKLVCIGGSTGAWFTTEATLEIEPDRMSSAVDPLLVHDLDGDGQNEMILAGKNQWLSTGKGGARTFQAFLSHPPPSILAAVLGDFDGDAAVDFLCANTDGLWLYRGHGKGDVDSKGDGKHGFGAEPVSTQFRSGQLKNPFVLTAGDIDGDRDLDVWLAQYKMPYVLGQMPTPYYDANDGYASFLMLNDGRGKFQDQTDAAGLAAKRFRRTYSSSFIDLDSDGDLDLVVVSDFAGTDIYLNDGKGNFTDVTRPYLDEPHAFGMAHTFGDYNGDGWLDLFVIGMNSRVADRLHRWRLGPESFRRHLEMRPAMSHGNRLYLGGKTFFRQREMSDSVRRSGWSWGAVSFDLENDGDLDLYVVNGHRSRRTARDYESEYWRHDIFAGNSRKDAVLDTFYESLATRQFTEGISYGGFDKNHLFVNSSKTNFNELAYLYGLSMEEDCRNVVADDFNHDGKMDLIVMETSDWPQMRHRLHLLRNECAETGHWIGFRFHNSKGVSPIGARVRILAGGRWQERWMVTGDSFRSQHPPAAHFGLGNATAVERVEVRWINGRIKQWRSPEVDRYHWVDLE
ncbi:MAG: CRTAC1 family protein [Verrucomicrobiota bacterium]